jgi:hypothetical protein
MHYPLFSLLELKLVAGTRDLFFSDTVQGEWYAVAKFMNRHLIEYCLCLLVVGFGLVIVDRTCWGLIEESLSKGKIFETNDGLHTGRLRSLCAKRELVQ